MTRSDNQNKIDALLLERAGYARRGLADRVSQVDKQLARLGHTPPETPKTPETVSEVPVDPQAPSAPPKGRRGSRKDTA